MSVCKNSGMLILLVLLVFCSSLQAKNMWENHGYNYSYSSYGSSGAERTIFPIAWDVRSANNLLEIWREIYQIDRPSPILPILGDSYHSGFNAAIIRSELGDRWFPPIPGSTGDSFFPFAASVREIGLDVFVGGLKTQLNQEKHNQSVINYLKLYLQFTQGIYPGEVIGCFAFDEPDVKYLENPDTSDQWVEFVSYWSEQCRFSLNLKTLCYFAKYADVTSDGDLSYYSDTTNVLYRMSALTDMVGIDMYPAKNNFRRTDYLESSFCDSSFVVITDLTQADPVNARALNSRDEVIGIIPAGDSSMVVVKEVHWDGIDLSLNQVWSSPLSFYPDGVCASDFRSGYYYDELSGSVNSAVVMWKDSLCIDNTLLLVSESGIPQWSQLGRFHGSTDYYPVFFCVGQTDYWMDNLQVAGIIGRGRLAVLACLKDVDNNYSLMLYIQEQNDDLELKPVFDKPFHLIHEPIGAVWGAFWGTWYLPGESQREISNGFVIYTENGDYITLNQRALKQWIVYPTGGSSFYHELFGSSEMPDDIKVSRVDGNSPPFFTGYDRLTGWFNENSRMVSTRSGFSCGKLNQSDTIFVNGLSGEVTDFDFLRNDHRYQDRSIFTTADSDVYIGENSFEEGLETGYISVEPVNYCYGNAIIGGIRAMFTRDAIRSVLIESNDEFCLPQSEIYSDVYDQLRYQWFPEAHQVGFNVGVRYTAINNCSFAVIQSYGRHGFALPSYNPSPDTMLYMIAAPIVHGARGLVFYALDVSMMSGNGWDDGFNRAPFILQNWGPSRDIENVDMIQTVHETIASVTGNSEDGVDYLSKLIDPSWRVFDNGEAFNSTVEDTLLNFLALTNTAGDSIIVITVNESNTSPPPGSVIMLNDLSPRAEIVSFSGFLPFITFCPDSSDLAVDYSSMKGVSASFITITFRPETVIGQDWWLNAATENNGVSHVVFSVPQGKPAKLVLFDLTGRQVKVLWCDTGSGSFQSFSLDSNEYSAGLYFLSLQGNDVCLTEKSVIW